MGHSSSKQSSVSTKEELANRRDPSFCNRLLGRLHRGNLAPCAREGIPITPITPKIQHHNVMGVIVPRVIASTYHAPPKDLTLLPSTSHTHSQNITPEQSTHLASIYTPNAISRRDTMSPIDHSMHRCPQKAKCAPRPRSPFPAATKDTSITPCHWTSTASTPPKYSASNHLQEEEENGDDDDDDDEDFEDCHEESHEEFDEEVEEVAESAFKNATLNASLRTCSERLRMQTIGGARISLHDPQGRNIHVTAQFPVLNPPLPPLCGTVPNPPLPPLCGTVSNPPLPALCGIDAAGDMINAANKGKGRQPWPLPVSEAYPNACGSATGNQEVDRWQDSQQFLFRRERPSFQDLSERVMSTIESIETMSGKEKSSKAQASEQARSKRHADGFEATRVSKRHMNESQVQTRMQTYLRDERAKQEAADLAYATKLFEEERQRAEAIQIPTPQPKECTVCSDLLPPLSFPAKPPTTTCTHTVNVCEACLQEWVSNQLTSNGWQGIYCPECPSTLSHPEMRLAASPATFTTYDTLSLRSTVSTLDNFAWCLAPNCNFGQENTPNIKGAFMECTSCRYRQCLLHKCAWHDDETCNQYDYRVSGKKARDEEAKNRKYLEKEARQCPGRACGAWIQKSSGCDHMTCRKCGTEFCYLCRASYARIRAMGNAAHTADCRYHSDNLYPH